MTNILRCFKHLFAAYITKCISIIFDYVRQRHISVVSVWPRVQVTFCILRLFFSLRWKMEMRSMIWCYHHQLKSFHLACVLRRLLRAARQTTPLAVCPTCFSTASLRFLFHGCSVCRSLLSHGTSYHYRSSHVGEKEIIVVNFLFALMLMQLWWNQKPELLAFSLIFFFFKYRTTDTDTSYCFRAPMSRTAHSVPFFPLGDYNGQHTDKSTHSYNCKMLWGPQKYSTLWDAEGHCGCLQIIKDKPWWSEQGASS